MALVEAPGEEDVDAAALGAGSARLPVHCAAAWEVLSALELCAAAAGFSGGWRVQGFFQVKCTESLQISAKLQPLLLGIIHT